MKGGERMAEWNSNNMIDIFASREFDFADKKKNVRTMTNYDLNRLTQMFKYKGLPDTVTKRDLELLVMTKGFGTWAEYGGNVYCLLSSLGGERNQNYMPTISIIANPYLNFNAELEIDKNCVVMPNDSMYVGVLPILVKHNTMLAENELTINIVDIISRVNDFLVANDDKAQKSAEKFIQDLIKGKIGVIAESGFMDNIRTLNTSSGSTSKPISEFIELEQYFKGSKYNELGLKSQFNMKREALNSSESELNDSVLLPLVDDMLECRQIAIDKVNKMFGLNITVEFNSAWEDMEEEPQEQEEQTDKSTRVEDEEPKEGEDNETEDTN